MDWAITGSLIGANTTAMAAVSIWALLQVQALKTDMRDLRQEMKAPLRQQNQDLLAILQRHTHSDEWTAVFHQFTTPLLKPARSFPRKTISR